MAVRILGATKKYGPLFLGSSCAQTIFSVLGYRLISSATLSKGKGANCSIRTKTVSLIPRASRSCVWVCDMEREKTVSQEMASPTSFLLMQSVPATIHNRSCHCRRPPSSPSHGEHGCQDLALCCCCSVETRESQHKSWVNFPCESSFMYLPMNTTETCAFSHLFNVRHTQLVTKQVFR